VFDFRAMVERRELMKNAGTAGGRLTFVQFSIKFDLFWWNAHQEWPLSCEQTSVHCQNPFIFFFSFSEMHERILMS
jgi:hypothetical protein